MQEALNQSLKGEFQDEDLLAFSQQSTSGVKNVVFHVSHCEHAVAYHDVTQPGDRQRPTTGADRLDSAMGR
jgi:hypothetical protein